jgi:asparagine synthase (glutamine-hydrolysing)
MCGIVGILTKNREAISEIDEMVEALNHRGPNAHHIVKDYTKGIALGHTRLSIIDLSEEANQPMESHDGRYVVVFNGEIYNYKELKVLLTDFYAFKTSSDTEVLLAAYHVWGARMVERLDGMFAFAIYDQHKQTIFLARDRLGKKPLYYYQDQSTFIFASEIKAIRKHSVAKNLRVDSEVFDQFLHLGYIGSNRSIFSSIRKVLPGHSMVVNGDHQYSESPYHKTNDHRKIEHANEVDVLSTFRSLLKKSVEKRLIGDVPMGCFLSGGTDSSLVAALMKEQIGSQLKTFSIGFEGGKFDELQYARHVAKQLGALHYEEVLTQKNAMDMLHAYLEHFDEPFSDTSSIPTMLVSKLAKQQITVALTGDGGDELFLGYGSHTWAERLKSFPFKYVKSGLTSRLLRKVGSLRMQRISYLLDTTKQDFQRSTIFSQEQYLFSILELAKLKKGKHVFIEPYQDVLSDQYAESEKQAYYDFQHYLINDLLVKVDRSSMFYGLECRCPLLDKEVVEYAWSLPIHFKRRDEKNKWLLKKMLEDYLPPDLIYRQKWGFSVPLDTWLNGELRPWIEKYLSKDVVDYVGIYNYEMIRSLVKDFYAGKVWLYNRVWVLFLLHRWLVKHEQ